MAKSKSQEKQYKYASAKDRATNHVSGGDRTCVKAPEGVGYFTLKKAGVYRIDIASYVVGKGNKFADEGNLHFERTFYTHRGIGPGGKDTYVCNQQTFGKKCPICDFVGVQRRNPSANPTALKELAPKERQLFLVMDHAEKEKGWQLWDISYHLFGKLLDAKIKNQDDGDDYDMFAHMSAGRSLKLEVTEKPYPQGKPFYAVEGIEFKARKPGEQYSDKAVENLPCLDDCLIETPYAKLKEIFMMANEAPEDDDKDEDDDTEEDDSEDDDAPSGEIEVGSTVKFEYRGEDTTGEVVKFDKKKGVIEAKVAGRSKPVTLDVDEVTLVESDPDDESDKDDDDSEEDEAPEVKKGDTVTLKVKGKTKTGVVTSVNLKNGVAAVKLEGASKADSFKISELTPVEDEDDDSDGDAFDGEEEDEDDEIPDDDDDSDFDADDEDDEDDEPAPPKKKGKK